MRRVTKRAAGAAFVLAAALAFVNPNFTPHHVEKQSKLICTVVLREVLPENKGVVLAIQDVLKGDTPATTITVDFTTALAGKDGQETVKEALAAFTEAAGRPAIFFSTLEAGEEDKDLMHVESVWLRLQKGAAPALWRLTKVDTDYLNGTFRGGTDMLIATMRFILRFPGVTVMRVDAGIAWDAHTKIGTLAEKAGMLVAADVNGDGKVDIYAASPGGDVVFLNRGEGKFEALEGLAGKSLVGAWDDFDGDGRLDLASLGKDGLVLHVQKGALKFTPVKVPLPGPVDSGSPTIAVIDLDADGQPDLVVGAGARPTVLRNAGEGRFEPVALADHAPGSWGAWGPCAVADFDSDGWVDIVQCAEKDGLYFRGAPGGRFEPGVPTGGGMGKVKRRKPYLGDLDGDGCLDILLVGGDRTPALLHNRSGGSARLAQTSTGGAAPSRPAAGVPPPVSPLFEEAMRLSGEPGYIIQTGADIAALGDFNNDSFLDLFVGYAEEPPQAFFNRGFRALAIAEPLKPREDEMEGVEKGQSAALWADFDGDGAEELVLALANGDVYVSQTTLARAERPVVIRVKVDDRLAYVGPVAVRWSREGHCLGVRTTGRWRPSALLAANEPGEYVLTWRLPGRPEQSERVIVERQPVDVTIGGPVSPSSAVRAGRPAQNQP